MRIITNKEKQEKTDNALTIMLRAVEYGFYVTDEKNDTFEQLLAEATDVLLDKGEVYRTVVVKPKKNADGGWKFEHDGMEYDCPSDDFSERVLDEQARVIEFTTK